MRKDEYKKKEKKKVQERECERREFEGRMREMMIMRRWQSGQGKKK